MTMLFCAGVSALSGLFLLLSGSLGVRGPFEDHCRSSLCSIKVLPTSPLSPTSILLAEVAVVSNKSTANIIVITGRGNTIPTCVLTMYIAVLASFAILVVVIAAAFSDILFVSFVVVIAVL